MDMAFGGLNKLFFSSETVFIAVATPINMPARKRLEAGA
jgi:hypothetical protein